MILYPKMRNKGSYHRNETLVHQQTWESAAK